MKLYNKKRASSRKKEEAMLSVKGYYFVFVQRTLSMTTRLCVVDVVTGVMLNDVILALLTLFV